MAQENPQDYLGKYEQYRKKDGQLETEEPGGEQAEQKQIEEKKPGAEQPEEKRGSTENMKLAGKSAEEEGRKCPWCGRSLVLRTARKGTNAGKQFYGCSNYPKCRYTENF